MMTARYTVTYMTLLVAIAIVLWVCDIMTGSISIGFAQCWSALTDYQTGEIVHQVVREIRLPRATTALISGVALAVSGLLLQTLLNNPLAGPSVLGITAGGSLGVALVVFGTGAVLSGQVLLQQTLSSSWGMVLAAVAGSVTVLLIILFLAARMYRPVVLLIVGLMIANIAGALIGILQFFSRPEDLQSFVMWSFGNLGGVQRYQLPLLAGCIFGALVPAIFTVKGLDLMQLDEAHARVMGVNMRRLRIVTLTSIGVMAGTVTAFCGPIAFVGIAIPHLTRGLTGFRDHRRLLPATAMVGAIVLLGCDIVSHGFGKGYALPLNAITAMIGSPVVIWVLLRKRNRRLQ